MAAQSSTYFMHLFQSVIRSPFRAGAIISLKFLDNPVKQREDGYISLLKGISVGYQQNLLCHL